MARAQDLVVFKAIAARPKDIEDAAALILMHSAMDLGRVRRLLAELAELAEEPALLDGLDEVIARAHAVRNASSKRRAVAEPPARARKRTPRRVRRKN
jgi:hypothetical protein